MVRYTVDPQLFVVKLFVQTNNRPFFLLYCHRLRFDHFETIYFCTMVSHKEFTAWITVDDKRVPEYCQEVDEQGRKASCYIPSEPGKVRDLICFAILVEICFKNFVVHWFDMGSKTFTAAYIQCDGFLTAGRYLNGYGYQSRSGIRSGPHTERPFKFAEIPQTSEY